MFQDLRYGMRMLLKHKGFTLVAVLSLALGIGANTALFSVVDAVMLRTLPVKGPSRLVLFEWQSGSAFRTNGMRGSFNPGPPGMRVASVFRHDIIEKMRQARSAGADDHRLGDGPTAWAGTGEIVSAASGCRIPSSAVTS